jgi:hypothetical protein
MTLLVILDVSAFILETAKTTAFEFNIFLIDIEVVSVVCFTILYILHLWSCTTLAFIGIGLFALPAGIIASGFSTEVERRKELESQELPEIISSLTQQSVENN